MNCETSKCSPSRYCYNRSVIQTIDLYSMLPNLPDIGGILDQDADLILDFNLIRGLHAKKMKREYDRMESEFDAIKTGNPN